MSALSASITSPDPSKDVALIIPVLAVNVKDKELPLPTFSTALNINPTQEISNTISAGIGIYSLLTGAPISKEEANDAIKEWERMAFGVLAGNEASKIHEEIENPKPFSFGDVVKNHLFPILNFGDVPNILSGPISYSKMYEHKKAVYDILDSSIPGVGMSNSFVNAAVKTYTRLLPAGLLIKDAIGFDTFKSDYDKKKIHDRTMSDIYNLVISLSSTGSYLRPAHFKKTFGNWEHRKMILQRLQDSLDYNYENNIDTSIEEEVMKQIKNYGKIYMNSIIKRRYGIK